MLQKNVSRTLYRLKNTSKNIHKKIIFSPNDVIEFGDTSSRMPIRLFESKNNKFGTGLKSFCLILIAKVFGFPIIFGGALTAQMLIWVKSDLVWNMKPV